RSKRSSLAEVCRLDFPYRKRNLALGRITAMRSFCFGLGLVLLGCGTADAPDSAEAETGGTNDSGGGAVAGGAGGMNAAGGDTVASTGASGSANKGGMSGEGGAGGVAKGGGAGSGGRGGASAGGAGGAAGSTDPHTVTPCPGVDAVGKWETITPP